MKHNLAICVGLTALGIASATSAQAQGYYGPPRVYAPPPGFYEGGLPESEVLMLVRAQGLTPLTRASRRGPRYVLLASDRMGGQLRVVVSAYNGRIIRVVPAHDPRFAYHPARPQAVVPVAPVRPQYGAPPPRTRYSTAPGPEVKDPPAVARAPRRAAPPAQTGSANDQRLASAPDTTELLPPRRTRTPLPRPRPATASNEAAAPTQEAAVSAPPAAPAATSTTPAATGKAAPAAIRKAAPARTTETPTPMVPVAPLE